MRGVLGCSLLWMMALSGCAPRVAYVPLNASPEPMARRSPAEVEVFHLKVPNRPFTEVALVESQATGMGTQAPETLLGKLREEAARQGCEGLIIGPMDERLSGTLVGDVGHVESRKGYRGTCIVFTDGGAAATGGSGAL